VTDLRWFAPENILETWYRIFNRRIDHYRQIIFVLTSDASGSQKFPESFSSLKALTDNGQLFSDVATTQVITSSLHLYVLIYEFDLEKKEGPKFLFASQVPVLDHLLNSKIRLQ
jgi:hypothetical protein